VASYLEETLLQAGCDATEFEHSLHDIREELLVNFVEVAGAQRATTQCIGEIADAVRAEAMSRSEAHTSLEARLEEFAEARRVRAEDSTNVGPCLEQVLASSCGSQCQLEREELRIGLGEIAGAQSATTQCLSAISERVECSERAARASLETMFAEARREEQRREDAAERPQWVTEQVRLLVGEASQRTHREWSLLEQQLRGEFNELRMSLDERLRDTASERGVLQEHSKNFATLEHLQRVHDEAEEAREQLQENVLREVHSALKQLEAQFIRGLEAGSAERDERLREVRGGTERVKQNERRGSLDSLDEEFDDPRSEVVDRLIAEIGALQKRHDMLSKLLEDTRSEFGRRLDSRLEQFRSEVVSQQSVLQFEWQALSGVETRDQEKAETLCTQNTLDIKALEKQYQEEWKRQQEAHRSLEERIADVAAEFHLRDETERTSSAERDERVGQVSERVQAIVDVIDKRIHQVEATSADRIERDTALGEEIRARHREFCDAIAEARAGFRATVEAALVDERARIKAEVDAAFANAAKDRAEHHEELLGLFKNEIIERERLDAQCEQNSEDIEALERRAVERTQMKDSEAEVLQEVLRHLRKQLDEEQLKRESALRSETAKREECHKRLEARLQETMEEAFRSAAADRDECIQQVDRVQEVLGAATERIQDLERCFRADVECALQEQMKVRESSPCKDSTEPGSAVSRDSDFRGDATQVSRPTTPASTVERRACKNGSSREMSTSDVAPGLLPTPMQKDWRDDAVPVAAPLRPSEQVGRRL